MIEPIFITDEETKEESLDFHFLKEKAIEYAQSLGGAIWTDYNEHDPGVTILEQLCYALTDLAYRAGFDIEDILQAGDKGRKTFMSPKEIFPCNALTIKDYRKLIFDSVFEIQNVWLKPVKKSEHSLNGLYKILIDIDENIQDEEQKEEIKLRVKNVFTQHRNLGEDIEAITILDNLFVTINADIEVDGKRPLEIIMAEIFFYVDEYLSPEIRFYSLEELRQKGVDLERIFEGPLLSHGFIQSEELFSKSSKVLISEVTKIIMEIPNVVSVKNLTLRIGDDIFVNQIDIEEHQLPILRPVVKNENGDFYIQFYKGGTRYGNIDDKIVNSELNELQSAYRRVYRLNEEEMAIPKGNKTDLATYFSIQNNFPQVYGITEYGITESSTDKRQAQVKQLRAYLMLFEQVIANYLSQLANVRDLLSVEPSLDKTYFYQLLDNVTNAHEIYQDKPEQIIDKAGIKHKKIPQSYHEGIQKIMEISDNKIDRGNRFVDFMLAIHGEEFPSSSLAQFNTYFSPKEFENQLLGKKITFLRFLPQINRNRARAYNYLTEALGKANLSGLEQKLSLVLGLQERNAGGNENTFVEHSTTYHFKDFGLRMLEQRPSKSNGALWVKKGTLSQKDFTSEDIAKQFDFLDREAFVSNIETPEDTKLLRRTLPFQSRVLSIHFLSEGLELERYRIGKYKENNSSYFVLFREGDLNKKEEENWIEIGKFSKREDAQEAVNQLISFLKSTCLRSEGIQIIEHILLRPEVWEQTFGIYFMNESGEPILRSKELYTFAERKEKVEALRNQLIIYENYSIEITENRDFEIYFKSKEAEIEMVSLQPLESVEKIHGVMEDLFDFLSDKSDINSYEEKVGFYIQTSENGSHIPEDFFTFRTSLYFPNWTARFGDKEFQRIATELAYNASPANNSLDIQWISFSDMAGFEDLFYKWMQLLRKESRNHSRLRASSAELTELILSLQKKYNNTEPPPAIVEKDSLSNCVSVPR